MIFCRYLLLLQLCGVPYLAWSSCRKAILAHAVELSKGASDARENLDRTQSRYDEVHREWKTEGVGGPGTAAYDNALETYIEAAGELEALRFELRENETILEAQKGIKIRKNSRAAKPQKRKSPAPLRARDSFNTFIDRSHPENSRSRPKDND